MDHCLDEKFLERNFKNKANLVKAALASTEENDDKAALSILSPYLKLHNRSVSFSLSSINFCWVCSGTIEETESMEAEDTMDSWAI